MGQPLLVCARIEIIVFPPVLFARCRKWLALISSRNIISPRWMLYLLAAFGTESISIIFQEGCLSSRASVWKILEVGFNVLFQLCFFFSNCRFDTIYSINRVGFWNLKKKPRVFVRLEQDSLRVWTIENREGKRLAWINKRDCTFLWCNRLNVPFSVYTLPLIATYILLWRTKRTFITVIHRSWLRWQADFKETSRSKYPFQIERITHKINHSFFLRQTLITRYHYS